MENIIKEIVNLIKTRWHKKSTIFIVVLFSSGVLLWLFSAIEFQRIEKHTYWAIGIILLILVLFWYYSNRIPKAPKGRIGFAVGIITDDPLQQQKIKRDFTQTLRDLLNRSRFRYSFAFVEIPNRFIEDISSQDIAIKILHETKCSFMVYGKARTITLNGQTQHVLNLEGVVAHKPISKEINESFSREFADLFPRRVTISLEGDLFKFEITANWIDTVSKYIIGVAALLSGDIGYAQELFENLQQTLSKASSNIPGLVKIKQRLPSRLEDIYIVQLNIFYDEWLRTKDGDLIVKMKPYLDKLKVVSPKNYNARFFRTLWYFVHNRDVENAKIEILKTSKLKHTAWQYNYAFLLAYEGNMQEAEKQYRLAVKEVFEEPRIVLDIVEFIMWVLSEEPDKTQLHYCLGVIYYYAIKDYSLALQDFEKFIASAPVNHFLPQNKEAKKMVTKIQKDINSGKIKLENEVEY